ncbi:MAG: methyl-accepting chemotaxis protein [Selenomonadaceae bacterium]|nr:methyl-accepting chemotaxis protein [Selenomonadaceae bacterium]
MTMFKNAKISTKLIALVIFLELIIVGVAFRGISQQSKNSDRYQRIQAVDSMAAITAHEMGMNFNEMRASMLVNISSAGIEIAQKNSAKNFAKTVAAIEKNYQELTGMAETQEAKDALKELHEKIGSFEKLAEAAMKDGSIYVNNTSARKAQYLADEVADAISNIAAMAKEATVKETGAIEEEISSNIKLNIGLAAVVVLASAVGGVALANSISSRIKVLSEAAGQIAGGDLSHALSNDSVDEIGETTTNFEMMRRNVRDTVAEINLAAEQVAEGSGNISQASVALSEGAAGQAAAVEELSTSIAEVAAQTSSNADNASKANELALLAKDNAAEGNTEMQDMLQAMAEIDEASNNISKIIRVIDEIAFQTNILALNASVEAARAGQHGKGFAVVAEEVRNLAARSAKAAKETTDLIESSLGKVDDGRKLANKAADSLNTIVANVSEVADLLSSIDTASREQQLALEQINQAVLQVSQVVQSNSATSEETAAASEELNNQAKRMRDAVNHFKLN